MSTIRAQLVMLYNVGIKYVSNICNNNTPVVPFASNVSYAFALRHSEDTIPSSYVCVAIFLHLHYSYELHHYYLSIKKLFVCHHAHHRVLLLLLLLFHDYLGTYRTTISRLLPQHELSGGFIASLQVAVQIEAQDTFGREHIRARPRTGEILLNISHKMLEEGFGR